MSESFIQDSGFAGSPIMSFGTESRKHRYIKLALAALALLFAFVIAGFFWFWFLLKIPMPNNAAVTMVVTSDHELSYDAPQEWRLTHNESDALPFLLGYAWDEQRAELVPFAIRLAGVTEAIEQGRLSQIRISKAYELGEKKALFDLFGWPWAWKDGIDILTIKPRLLLNSENTSLPERISGRLSDGQWRTDLVVNESDLTELSQELEDWALISEENDEIVEKYLRAQGVILPVDYRGLAWDEQGEVVFLTKDRQDNLILTSSTVELVKKPYTLPDGDTATVYYLDSENVTSTLSLATSSASLMSLEKDVVQTDLCPGKVVAIFSEASAGNVCSWFGGCGIQIEKLVFSVRDNRLVICY